MAMNSQDILKGRIAARAQRLDEPREPRIGKIKLGILVRSCKACGKKKQPASIQICPECGKSEWGNTYPDKTNYYVFYEDSGEGVKAFGNMPTVIPFTFLQSPQECIRIGRECYQGGKMFCHNWFEIQPYGDFLDTQKANRTGIPKLITCDPLTCPYSIGSPGINPKQCGETVILNTWLPHVPGYDYYQYKSRSIETINNIQSAIKKIIALKLPPGFQLELRLKKSETQFPDEQGLWKKTGAFYVSVIHFPFAMVEIQEKAKAGTLNPADYVYMLPTGILRPQLPESTYDPLIDERHQIPEEIPSLLSETIGNVQTGESQKPNQAIPDPATEKQIDIIRSLFEQWQKGKSDRAIKEFNRNYNLTWKLPRTKDYKTDWTQVTENRALEVIRWFERILEDEKIKAGKIEEQDDPENYL